MRTHSVIARALLLLMVMSSWGATHAACTVTSSALAFGAYNPASSANVDVLSSVRVRCRPKANVNLSLSVGSGAGARYSTGRKMTRLSGGGTLTYNLYADAARTNVLGDGTDGSLLVSLSGKDLVFQVFGRIQGPQPTVKAGSYGDTVFVTVSY